MQLGSRISTSKPFVYLRVPSSSRTVRCRRICLAPKCEHEARKWFIKRIETERGWEGVRPLTSSTSVHPIVRETWAAMEDIYGLGILETPLEPSAWLHAFTGVPAGSVHLKMENQQVTGSFKVRGAAHKLFSLSDNELGAGIVTSSTGNHALAMLQAASALAAAGRPIDLTVYIPATISAQKAAKLFAAAEKNGENAPKVVTVGTGSVEAELAAREFAASTGRTYVSPYNDYKVAGGQGTVGVELLMQTSPGKLDVVFVPVGGGGLVAGVAALLKSIDPHIRVVGCQPEVSDVMRRSVAAGHVVELPHWEETFSDGTAGGIEAGSVTLDVCRAYVDEWITVTEQEIAAAMVGVHGHHGVAIEGSAGVAVAAFIKSAAGVRGKHAVIICCGGNVAGETLDKAYEMTRQKGKGGTLRQERGPAASF